MNGQKLLSQFISLAIKKNGYEDRDNATFTLKEIKSTIKFFLEIKTFDSQPPIKKSPLGDNDLRFLQKSELIKKSSEADFDLARSLIPQKEKITT